jgi:phage baseplate assembly protein W
MTTPLELYGADLGLLRDLTTDSSRDGGHDLLRQLGPSAAEDLARRTGVDNLRQALLLRFLTPAGELTALGHPAYGSRLFELIGQPNNQTTQNLAKLYVLLALGDEPRVSHVLSVDVATSPSRRDELDLTVSVQPIDSPSPLDLVLPFSLSGGGGS